TGKIVRKQKTGDERITWNLLGLKPGIYAVSVRNNSETITMKVVVK
ncbi:MAG: T9SS type A sorting domain-containing protein, partial [Bacteroidetes bacterium]|nr:T9SS type A sorting domain-containing protein [Bacteroidota bacterium]